MHQQLTIDGGMSRNEGCAQNYAGHKKRAHAIRKQFESTIKRGHAPTGAACENRKRGSTIDYNSTRLRPFMCCPYSTFRFSSPATAFFSSRFPRSPVKDSPRCPVDYGYVSPMMKSHMIVLIYVHSYVFLVPVEHAYNNRMIKPHMK